MTGHTVLPLKITERLSLKFYDDADQCQGDSLGLQKGLVLFVGAEPMSGEGVGFGVPAVKYSDQILFSTTATLARDKELVKSFSMDAVHRVTWRGKFIDNGVYRAIQHRLAETYRATSRFRPTLTRIMQIQSLLGIKLSHQKISSRGVVDVSYRLYGNRLMITVDSSKLIDKDFMGLFVFNEQSADFNIYEDELVTLSDEKIGVWEEVKSQKASLTSQILRVTFSVENMAGARLFRGRELLKPRLNWSGFCYFIPPQVRQYGYSVRIN